MNNEQQEFLKAQGVDITPTEDTGKMEFKPLKGVYKVIGKELERLTGDSQKTGNPYDFYKLSCQATETLEGDKGNNRYFSQTFFNGTSEFTDDPDQGVQRLIKALITANVDLDFDSSDSDLHGIIEKNKIRFSCAEFFIRTWVKNDVQKMKIVANPIIEKPVADAIPA